MWTLIPLTVLWDCNRSEQVRFLYASAKLTQFKTKHPPKKIATQPLKNLSKRVSVLG